MKGPMVAGVGLAILLSLAASRADAQPECRQQYELGITLDAGGKPAELGDADAQEGCTFTINIQNDSASARNVRMTLERTIQGNTRAFDICRGSQQLKDPRVAPPGSSQITCVVRPGLLASTGAAVPALGDRDDAAGPSLRVFKYTLYVNDASFDPDIRIQR
jgi:hypothetical protein